MSGGRPQDKAVLMNWIRKNSPTREELLESRFVKPFAHRVAHSHLWRFSRTSVRRGTALGLFVGIFFLIPGVQILGVALLALPFRANIPIGAAMTFLSNPVRSEEHTSELQSLMRISYAVFCLKKKKRHSKEQSMYH